MKRKSYVSVLLAFAGIILIFFLVSPSGCFSDWRGAKQTGQTLAANDPKAFAPTEAQMLSLEEILLNLEHRHYTHLPIDDELSNKVFNNYLKAIDENRLYLSAEDVAEFEPLRFKLDDTLLAGDVTPAYKIYKRFQERYTEHYQFLLKQLDQEAPKFDTNESFQADRSKADWVKNKAELESLWLKRFKADYLNLKLAGKTADQIKETLKKRYEYQLKGASQVKNEDVFQAYMNALTMSYDPHTQYFSPRTSENFKINMSLSLEGIGAMLEPEFEYTKIARLIPGGPAARAGNLKPADRIVGVGQGAQGKIVDVVGWRLDDVVDLIRGTKGSTVRLEIIPADQTDIHQTKIVTLVRDTIKLEEQAAKKKILTVKRGGVSHRIGIIDLPAFYSDFDGARAGKADFRSTTRDVKRLLEELKQAHVEAVMIDLRDNGGGSLPEVNSLVGLFIDRGPTVLVRSTGGRIDVQNDSDPSVVYDGPLAVVVNRLSASASEIFAGAIQDYGRGLIIGQQTYGKGTVQALIDLMGDKDAYGQIKLTQAKFYRISGESTQDRGVTPDIDLPSLIDAKIIGESASPEALPWDKIFGVNHRSYGDFKPYMPLLKKRHVERMAKDADYAYMNASIKLIDQVREQKLISLNEAVRLKEQADLKKRRLDIENAKRLALHEAPLKALEDEDDEKDAPIKDIAPEDDFILRESGQIMIDLIEFLSNEKSMRKAG